MKITGERKIAAARLAEIIGQPAVYTRVPRCAYEVGVFAIERDGTVTVPESADLAPLRTLAQEGLLEGWEEESSITEENAPEAATEAQDALVADSNAQGTLTISLPLVGHTANSLRNLVTMLYARGRLLSKATGGNFSCPLAQVDALKDCLTTADVLARITPDLAGLTFAEEEIIFAFPFTEDTEKIKAFTQLAAKMCAAANKQKRVIVKLVEITNERYAFRIWLLSLGMSGDEFKAARQLLMKPLSGSAAFKDTAMEERWKEKHTRKGKA